MKRWLILLLLCTAVWAQPAEVKTKTIVEGYGKPAEIGDSVKIAYVLRLANGDIVDASADGAPFAFTLGANNVVPGMTAGVLGMKRGETREIEIPPSLGYGSKPVGPIPPDSTLFLEVKLQYFSKEGASDELHDKFGKEGFENRPDARSEDKPAVFEYLIRDFFTRPWRYEDSARLTWKANGILSLVILAVWGLCAWADRRGGRP